jgi:hypothetical protein
MFGIPFGNTSTTIVQLAIAFLASSSCTILEFSATAAAAARSQKQRRQYRAGKNVWAGRAIAPSLHILAELEAKLVLSKDLVLY